ncbi:MAG: cytochrome c biogenesis CcdA family protein, partial [Vicinamibacteraceae bacterium]
MDVSIVAAFAAGLVSFLSPCVLPLAPGYVSMLTGIGVDQLQRGEGARSVLIRSSLAFVTGFSVVFVAFGASATAVGQFLVGNKTVLTPLAGGIILLFGFHLLGWLRRIPIAMGVVIGLLLVALALVLRAAPALTGSVIAPIHLIAVSPVFWLGPFLSRFLDRDVRFHRLGGQPGVVGAFLMGFAFAFGWTPCIGPILASVLALAATHDTVAEGAFLLAVYSAGLAIPFVLMAVGVARFLHTYRRFRRLLWAVEAVSGVL